MSKVLTWRTCRGRNAWDHPLEVPDDMAVEVLNLDLQRGELGEKRSAATEVTLDTSTSGGFSALAHLGRFVPGQVESVAEMHFVTTAATPEVLKCNNGNVVSAKLTLTDNFTNSVPTVSEHIVTVQLNNKLYYFGDTSVNRLHKYDPQLSTTALTRAGLAPPSAAPTVANSAGGGAYPAVQRWYVQAFQTQVGGKIVAQSEYSSSVAFTPSGAKAAATVTRAAVVDGNETHWVLAASATGASGPFYGIATIAIGTTTYDDSALVATYDDGTAIPTVGSHYPFPSCKFGSTDGTHLFGLGVYETSAGVSVTPVAGRLYFSPAIGSSINPATDDDERIMNTVGDDATTGWIDLNIGARGVDAGLSEWVQGVMFAFQSRGIYMIIPTGSNRTPFRAIQVSKTHGATAHRSIITGEDEGGNPCVYFWDQQFGPCRITIGGDIYWLGKDVIDVVRLTNVSAANTTVCGLYDAPNKQIKYWVAVSSEAEPATVALTYHTTLGRVESGNEVRGGWSKWTGNYCKVRAVLMFAKSFSTATRPLANVPYMASSVTNVKLMVQEGTGTQDAGPTTYQGSITSKAFDIEPIGRRKRVWDAYVVASAESGVTIRFTLTKDFGTETLSRDFLLTPTASETYVRNPALGADMSDLVTFQVTIGDSAAQNVALWSIERFQAFIDNLDTP